MSLGMSESTRDQRMTPQLAPVAVVDLTVPRATEGERKSVRSLRAQCVVKRKGGVFERKLAHVQRAVVPPHGILPRPLQPHPLRL